MMFYDRHKLLRLLALVAFAITALAGCASRTPSAPPQDSALDQIARIPRPSVAGPQRSLADSRGKIVLLHFFSSWCVQCAMEAPTLRNLHLSFSDSPFTVIGVAVDDDPFQMQAFVSKFQLPFPVILDETGELKTFFSVKELPATLFLDKRGVPIRFQDPETGNVTAMITGPRVWDATRSVEMIAALVEGM